MCLLKFYLIYLYTIQLNLILLNSVNPGLYVEPLTFESSLMEYTIQTHVEINIRLIKYTQQALKVCNKFIFNKFQAVTTDTTIVLMTIR